MWYRLASANPRRDPFTDKIFKAILHSLYPHIILFSNTENIVSPFQCGFPIAGNKRQDSHSHWLCLHGAYNHIKRKTINHCRLSTLLTLSPPLQNLGFCKAGEPVFISGIAGFLSCMKYPYPAQLHMCSVRRDCALSLLTTWPARIQGMRFPVFCENRYKLMLIAQEHCL